MCTFSVAAFCCYCVSHKTKGMNKTCFFFYPFSFTAFRKFIIIVDLTAEFRSTTILLLLLIYLSFRASQDYNIIYNKPTRCNSVSIVFINNYRYALHVSDALCVHHQEHYKL